MTADTIPIQVEFGGGLELLFSNQRTVKVDVPSRVPLKPTGAQASSDETALTSAEAATQPVNLTYLMYHLRDNLLKDRPELFMSNGTITPGILVLVNDSDWELEGEGDYELKANDQIIFISTLHGG